MPLSVNELSAPNLGFALQKNCTLLKFYAIIRKRLNTANLTGLNLPCRFIKIAQRPNNIFDLYKLSKRTLAEQ